MQMVSIRLIPINPIQPGVANQGGVTLVDGAPNAEGVLDTVRGIVEAQQSLYARTGAASPWIGYLAVHRATGEIVGSCSFVGPPSNGSVEIAYFTFPPFEGKGFASAMAVELVSISRASESSTKVHAFTLPDENPSTRILRRLGFERAGTARDDDAGDVWRWQLE